MKRDSNNVELDWIDESLVEEDFDIGEVAQDRFKAACSIAGVAANRATQDVKGWDFILEFPTQQAKGSQWSLDAAEVTAKVQVKGSTLGQRSVPIKLSNLYRMGMDPLPWFLVAYRFDDTGATIGISVIHIDELITSKIRNRILKAPPELKLHKAKMRLSWPETCDVPADDERAIVRRIKRLVGCPIHQYVEQKRAWSYHLAELERAVRGTATVTASSQAEALSMLADLAIGAVDRVALGDVEILGGVASKLSNGHGGIQISNLQPTGTLFLEVQASDETARISCDAYPSVVFDWLPAKYARVRLVCGPLSLIVHEGETQKVDWKLRPLSGPESIITLGSVCRALRLASHKGAQVIIRDDSKEVMRFETGTPDKELDDDVTALITAAESALWLSRTFEIPDSQLVDPAFLIHQSRRFSILRALVDRRYSLPAIQVAGIDRTDVEGKKGAVLVCPGVVLGESVAVICAALIGNYEVEGTSLAVNAPEVRIMTTVVVNQSVWEAKHTTQKLLDDAEEILSAEGLYVCRV